jgi:hypothetical protein
VPGPPKRWRGIRERREIVAFDQHDEPYQDDQKHRESADLLAFDQG